ncbi:hypothetical protein C8J56DRAFT_1112185 [Mycena floridula]|nr:hypothetical protein C8J56DRAFT_1112185 [Mycena floridula]
MSRARLPTTGKFLASPERKRNPVNRTRFLAESAPRALRLDALIARRQEVEALVDQPEPVDEHDSFDDLAMVDDPADVDYGTPMPESPNTEPDSEALSAPMDTSDDLTSPDASQPALDTARKPRRLEPDADSLETYRRWQSLLPILVDPYLGFYNATYGKPNPIPSNSVLQSRCRGSCQVKTCRVQCIFLDCVYYYLVHYCLCQDAALVLVANGLFPASPKRPRTAFSLTLLDLYRAMWERSCDAVNAFSSALQSHLEDRGFPFLTKTGSLKIDPNRKALTAAIQWYECLRQRVTNQVKMALEECGHYLESIKNPPPSSDFTGAAVPPANSSLPNSSAPKSTRESPNQTMDCLSLAQCYRLLRDRCPACFGGKTFGRPFSQGGDIHVSTDGNFHQRHDKSAGNNPDFYQPDLFLSKAYVDAIGEKMLLANGKRPKPRRPKLPDEAVDACQEAHHAAKGERKKKSSDKFDDTGLMSLICRHDVPLFMVNIDTPGEQQKYPVALLTWLFTLLPIMAMVTAFYDLGCVMDRSCELYEYFPAQVLERLQFATTAMHAYAHQWSCQLVYNPRLYLGLGLTDGEGVERIWSMLCHLIGITRHCSRNRRIWYLDRLSSFVGELHRDSFGEWINRKLKRVQADVKESKDIIDTSGNTVEELRAEWELQKADGISVRAHAPVRLKKELEQVMQLQAEVDTLDETIATVKASVQKSPDAMSRLRDLGEVHQLLKTKCEKLYQSLNVHDKYPELAGVDLPFVQVLLAARDLKITIRKLAIGTFEQTAQLDQAVGGVHLPLGTKKHQLVRRSISDQAPALMSLIRKFNDHCDTMRTLLRPGQTTPIPHKLPTSIQHLRTCSYLSEDVWISPTADVETPRWLEDLELRKAIRARLHLDRCEEERRRLAFEADSVSNWFRSTVAELELALRCPKFSSLAVLLGRKRDHLLSLRKRWSNKFVPLSRFDGHVAAAVSQAERLTGANIPLSLVWIPERPEPTVPDDESDEEELGDNIPEPSSAGQILIADLLIVEDTPDDSDDPGESDHKPSSRQSISPPPQRASQNFVAPDILPLAPLYAPPELTLTIIHSIPNLQHDDGVLTALLAMSSSYFPVHGPSDSQRVFHQNTKKGLRRDYIMPEEIPPLQKSACLNDACINVGAAVLFDHFITDAEASGVALLPSLILPTTQGPDAIWRTAKSTLYWNRGIWILPFHRETENHWVLYVVYLNIGRLHLFDSFGAPARPSEGAIVMRLVATLINEANKHGHALMVPLEDWTLYPMLTRAVQHNLVDCGVWILYAMIPVFRGAHLPATIPEKDINVARKCILRGIYNLPMH